MAVYLSLSLAGMALVLGATAGFLSWLWRRFKRLERECQECRQGQERLLRDLADLCTTAARTDEQVRDLTSRLGAVQAWVQERQDQASEGELTYQTAIERIRQGADVEELVESLGFSREEAALLIRLHHVDPASGKESYWES